MVKAQSPFRKLLVWSKVKGKRPREFELKDGSETIAKVRWQKWGGSLAFGECPLGNWSFKRTGFFSTQVTVRKTDSETDEAVFYPGMFGGGRIVFADGRNWEFKGTGFLVPDYRVIDTQGREVLNLKLKSFGSKGELQFGEAKPDERTCYLLAMLVWYASVLAKEDNDATAAIIATMCVVLLL